MSTCYITQRLHLTAVACYTEADARCLLSHLHELGYVWSDGSSLLKSVYWEKYKDKTTYHIGGNFVTYGDYCYYNYYLVDLSYVLSTRSSVTPDEFYSDVLIAGSEVDELS